MLSEQLRYQLASICCGVCWTRMRPLRLEFYGHSL